MTTITRRAAPGLLLACLGLALLGGGRARAAVSAVSAVTAVTAVTADASAGTISLDQPAYTAHENQGTLAITIQRTGDLSHAENVGYGVKRQDAQPGIDFNLVPNTYVTFAPGQTSYTFNVRIIDRGINATPVGALAYLYGSYPDQLGANCNSMVTILHDDPLQTRDDFNPLGVTAPIVGNPIAGTRFFVDPDSAPAKAARQYARSKPAWSGLLGKIAGEPGAHRFYMWNMGSNVEGQVAHYLETTQLQEPGTTVMLSTYSLVHGACGYTATAAIQARYDEFIRQVAAGIGNDHVVFLLELDALITAPCLSHAQLAIRDAELKYAITVLEADPHVVVYIDGGAADAASPSRQAAYLRGGGVTLAQGFFLNSTHFDWTSSNLSYGQKVSKLLGGAHFLINTGENGRGPLRPKNLVTSGNEVLCNPPGRGLGPLSLENRIAQPTGFADADGLLWFSNPGGSGGACVAGAPPTGVYWPAYAVMLAKNWSHSVTGPRVALIPAARSDAVRVRRSPSLRRR